jgi:hypothetical protein
MDLHPIEFLKPLYKVEGLPSGQLSLSPYLSLGTFEAL